MTELVEKTVCMACRMLSTSGGDKWKPPYSPQISAAGMSSSIEAKVNDRRDVRVSHTFKHLQTRKKAFILKQVTVNRSEEKWGKKTFSPLMRLSFTNLK